jgi:anti-sigma factor RsiW
MSPQPAPLSDQDLHAFIDGEVDPARAVEIAAMIERSPEIARRVERFRADKTLLMEVYGPLIAEPLPPALVGLCEVSAPRRRPTPRLGLSLALAALLILVIAGLGLRGRLTPDDLVEAAVAARSGATLADADFEGTALPTREVGGQTLRQVLDQPLAPPDLRKAGYELARMTLYRGAVQLGYRNGVGKRFTVYLRRSHGGDRFDVLPRGGETVCVWQNADLAAVMIGEMSTSEMLRVASLTYADLNF